MPEDNKTDGLIKRIKSNTGDTPVVLSSQSYDKLSTQELEPVCEAISGNPLISEVDVALTVTERGAEKIVAGFLGNEQAETLSFNILARVDRPSQSRLTRFQGQLEEMIDDHNAVQVQHHQQSLLCLSSLGKRNAKCIPTELLRDKIMPMSTPKRKKLIAE